MNPLIIAGAIVALPVIVLTVLRINAAMVFLSLCLGQVLVMFVSQDAATTIGIINSRGTADIGYVSLGLLIVPAILTGFCMIGTVRKHYKLVFNALPALAVGGVGLLLVVPLLSPGLAGAIQSTVIWEQVKGLQTLVVGGSALVSLFFLWLQRPKSSHGGEEDKKKHK